MDQALADRRKERLKYMTHDELIDDAAQFRGDMDEDERYALMERCARGEPMRFVEVPENSLLRRPLLNYRCLYPHPLPIDSGKGRGGDLKITKLDNDLAMRDFNHAGCDVNVETTSGVTPTYNALAAGHVDVA